MLCVRGCARACAHARGAALKSHHRAAVTVSHTARALLSAALHQQGNNDLAKQGHTECRALLTSAELSLYHFTTYQGRARTQSPTTTNYAVEIPTFGEFVRVSYRRSAMAEPRQR